MKKVSVQYLLVIMAVISSQFAVGLEDVRGKSTTAKPTTTMGNGVPSKGAQCIPSVKALLFQFNDVAALLQQGGRLFENPGTNTAGYEIPKGSGLKAIFAGSLWMGGVDANGQLKLAAVRFKQLGNDFWAGPLSVTLGSGNYDPSVPAGDDVVRDFGSADILSSQCDAYDKFFTIQKGEVKNFKIWWDYDQGITTTPVEKPNNEIMQRIINWPAHGDIGLNQDYYLAPFYDNDGGGSYNPIEEGDYPWYDDILGRDDIACGVDRRISLFGDETHWWVFNDKGNIHNETGGDPIGMEIRAQAFAFATNDEVNRMTFYNYELINRGVQTLYNTYFSQWLDPDLGNANDDYVGCDVSRGLGYAFNGDNNDETASANIGYGVNPPAIGIDFFEGPYLDADGIDNPGPRYDSINKLYVPPTVQNALDSNGIVYRGIGTGYSDNIVDNERFGMRRFTYFTNGASFPYTDPSSAAQYYNFMEGSWANGSEMYYGGTGAQGTGTLIPSDYMFPGDSDPLHWATAGANPGYDWSEASTDGASGFNPPGDRRFVQSAGPFTLRPGAVNNITVGIVYARGASGDLFGSVNALKRADTKAQALFDACFKILDPPNAPRLQIQELENELILTIDNPIGSNNFEETYAEEDKINIVDEGVDRFYRFEGYQIFQLVNSSAGISDIADKTKARLAAQCDIKNFELNSSGVPILTKPIDRLINFEFDEELGWDIPVEKVNGANEGVRHSFKVTEDLFAQGTRTLVNHKTYYYVAVAYAFNNYSDYDPNDALKVNGQKVKYIASRLGYDQTAIKAVTAIPHNPMPEAGGTYQYSEYGTTPKITRLDGHGNGGRVLELTTDSENKIVSDGYMATPEYESGHGPINIKVVDPLNVADGYFELEFRDYNTTTSAGNAADTAKWVINRYDAKGGNLLESVHSEHMIFVNNEQLIPQWGVSVQINQTNYFTEIGSGSLTSETTDLLESSMTFADSSKRWLTTISDDDSYSPKNWIRSGTFDAMPATSYPFPPVNGEIYESGQCYKDEIGKDPSKRWTKVLSGGMAPHQLVGFQCDFMPLAYWKNSQSYPTSPESTPGNARSNAAIAFTPSIDIVITTDKSKWTRCPVIELGRDAALNVGGAKPGGLRKSPSLDQNGNTISGSTGMSYFPGYAIDIETGARLNMAFGENSFLGQDGGNDMKWEPSANMNGATGNPLLGGMHPIYVFSHKQKEINGYSSLYDMGYYTDGSTELKDLIDLVEAGNGPARINFYSSLTWVGYPIRTANHKMFETDVRIRVRVNKEYKNYTATGENGGKPKYSWSMADLIAKKSDKSALAEVLNMIKVVPNPYYAFSEYERNRLDTRVKITNLPEVCNVNIYSTNGKLIRSFKKDSPVTSIDWDLNNQIAIPVASGVYLIHVDVPDVGEVVLKFFCGIRQVDLQGI
ncbi:MAG: T9SS type A sorting domain-containing protein [Crocinitomicaceae bacterium]